MDIQANTHLNTETLKNKLRNTFDEIGQIGAKSGISFKAHSDYSLNLFLGLPFEIQKEVDASLKGYLSILNAVEPDPFRIKYESNLLREASKKLNLIIPEDFISTVLRRDICEAYHLESRTQIYRNLEFLKYCSYDPCMMALKPWNVLFHRDPEVEKALFNRAEEVTRTATGVEPWGLENHIIVEKLTKERNAFEIILKNIAPCFHSKTGERIGWASTIRVRPLGSSLKGLSNVTIM